MKALVDMLHLLLCQMPHIYDIMKIVHREEGNCYYYLENDIAHGDTLPDHLKWRRVVENFKASTGMVTDKEALEFIKRSIECTQNIKRLVGTNESKMNFIRTLIDL